MNATSVVERTLAYFHLILEQTKLKLKTFFAINFFFKQKKNISILRYCYLSHISDLNGCKIIRSSTYIISQMFFFLFFSHNISIYAFSVHGLPVCIQREHGHTYYNTWLVCVDINKYFKYLKRDCAIGCLKIICFNAINQLFPYTSNRAYFKYLPMNMVNKNWTVALRLNSRVSERNISCE